jgi:hypothetical protein
MATDSKLIHNASKRRGEEWDNSRLKKRLKVEGTAQAAPTLQDISTKIETNVAAYKEFEAALCENFETWVKSWPNDGLNSC